MIFFLTNFSKSTYQNKWYTFFWHQSISIFYTCTYHYQETNNQILCLVCIMHVFSIKYVFFFFLSMLCDDVQYFMYHTYDQSCYVSSKSVILYIMYNVPCTVWILQVLSLKHKHGICVSCVNNQVFILQHFFLMYLYICYLYIN